MKRLREDKHNHIDGNYPDFHYGAPGDQGFKSTSSPLTM